MSETDNKWSDEFLDAKRQNMDRDSLADEAVAAIFAEAGLAQVREMAQVDERGEDTPEPEGEAVDAAIKEAGKAKIKEVEESDAAPEVDHASAAYQQVDAIFRAGGIKKVNEVMMSLTRNEQPVPEELPDKLQRFLEQTAHLPDWHDPDKIKVGQKLFSRFSPEIVAILFCKSLPECYCAEHAARVLDSTKLLTKFVHRRVVETAQFVLDVMAPGGLDPDKAEARGLRSAQKVRLLHASIRHLLLQQNWDSATCGKPINQEDLAGTLLSFSYLTLDGLKRLGNDFTDKEISAYMHAWNVVGYIMGVDEDMFVDTMEEAKEFWGRMAQRQFRPNEYGQRLSKALIDYLEQSIPGTVFDDFACAMVRFLVDEEFADMTGVPNTLVIRMLRRNIIAGPVKLVLSKYDDMGDESDVIKKIFRVFNRKVLEGLVNSEKAGKEVYFRIPPSLERHEGWRELAESGTHTVSEKGAIERTAFGPVNLKLGSWQVSVKKTRPEK